VVAVTVAGSREVYRAAQHAPEPRLARVWCYQMYFVRNIEKNNCIINNWIPQQSIVVTAAKHCGYRSKALWLPQESIMVPLQRTLYI